MNIYLLKKHNKKKIFYLEKTKLTVINNNNKNMMLIETFKKNWYFLSDSKLFVPRNQLRYFFNKITFLYKSLVEEWFYEIKLFGKGFKIFKYKDFFAFDLGYSNLFLFKNKALTIYATKQKIIIKSSDQKVLKNLLFCIFNFYKIDRYHGKGVLIPSKINRVYKKLM